LKPPVCGIGPSKYELPRFFMIPAVGSLGHQSVEMPTFVIVNWTPW
jgi:hypothetical protein